jgi:hypothetical protein
MDLNRDIPTAKGSAKQANLAKDDKIKRFCLAEVAKAIVVVFDSTLPESAIIDAAWRTVSKSYA